MRSERYDRIGRSYVASRGEDPRIAAAIRAALGDVRTVLNVGAGAGAYEPRDPEVTAVEPSALMRAQRPPGAAPCIDARAESLPFADGAFDASVAVLSDHHRSDRAGGMRELRRVALAPQAEVDAMVSALRADLGSGAWAERHADLLERDALDLGWRVSIAE